LQHERPPMPIALDSAPDFDERLAYQIRLKGHLANDWAEWFGGLSITLDADGTTRLISPAIDQAALHGLLKKIRDLGLPLISINPIEPDRPMADSSQLPTKGHEA
jgi:hypothetical protein